MNASYRLHIFENLRAYDVARAFRVKPQTYWPLLPLLIDIGGQTKHLCEGTWTVLNCSENHTTNSLIRSILDYGAIALDSMSETNKKNSKRFRHRRCVYAAGHFVVPRTPRCRWIWVNPLSSWDDLKMPMPPSPHPQKITLLLKSLNLTGLLDVENIMNIHSRYTIKWQIFLINTRILRPTWENPLIPSLPPWKRSALSISLHRKDIVKS